MAAFFFASNSPLPCDALVVVGIGRRTLVVDEVRRVERSIDGLERKRSLSEVEAIRKIVGVSVGVVQRRQAKKSLR